MAHLYVDIIGGGLAGSEAALQLANRGYVVRLYEMRPQVTTPVHHTGDLAELVCSNSLKSTKPDSAAGMLKAELDVLDSYLYAFALDAAVPAGGALAVDRQKFAQAVTEAVENHPRIVRVDAEVIAINPDASLTVVDAYAPDDLYTTSPADALIIASGPLTSDALSESLKELIDADYLAFYDAAAPIVEADSLDYDKIFTQSRYDEAGVGDYLNAAFTKEEYEHFIQELCAAQTVIKKDFETKELFQACQPIEEIARNGFDAPRFGPLKPVGLTDPRTGRRPWAVVQLRAENAHRQSFNLVGFQTNLTFPEQKRVFSLIPGLEQAEFSRYGVMHRNTFVDAPRVLNADLSLKNRGSDETPIFIAGQLAGTEGYAEAIRSGLQAALSTAAHLSHKTVPQMPEEMVFGALLAYATNPETKDYQPMHVNFGILPPLSQKIKNKQQRYHAYAERGKDALQAYKKALGDQGLLLDDVVISSKKPGDGVDE